LTRWLQLLSLLSKVNKGTRHHGTHLVNKSIFLIVVSQPVLGLSGSVDLWILIAWDPNLAPDVPEALLEPGFITRINTKRLCSW
jgi:hypothetical protein